MVFIDQIKGQSKHDLGRHTMKANQVLHTLLKNTCPMMHKIRRLALKANIMAALHGTRLTVTDLGRSIQSQAKQKHCIKRADRLLSNTHLHTERGDVYTHIALLLIGSQTRPLIIVDWSDMDEYGRHYLLRASIPVNGRSLTLYEEVHTQKRKEKPGTHLDFLRQLKTMLPEGCYPIIVSDAGFRVPWFKLVESFGWDWVGRVRNRTMITLAGGRAWKPCKSLYLQATSTPQALGKACMAQSNPIDCQLVLYKGKPKGRVHKNRLGKRSNATRSRKAAAQGKEPWLLATSLPPGFKLAKKLVKCYTCRMQIEEAFRDLKSTRFGLSLELHLSYQVERLQILLLIAALALMVAWLMGKATELTQQHRQYQANTIKDRQVLSTIFIGLRIIDDPRVSLKADDIVAAWQTLGDLIQWHCGFESTPLIRAH